MAEEADRILGFVIWEKGEGLAVCPKCLTEEEDKEMQPNRTSWNYDDLEEEYRTCRRCGKKLG